ncbi:MAG: inorganic diphosphatase [Solirubrobacterales bacterium]
MAQPLCERIACERISGPIRNCTPPSSAFRKSFEGATVQDIAIKGDQAAARFSNGEAVELVHVSGYELGGPTLHTFRQKAAKMGGAMSERLLCVIEIPKGSRNKYELDHETGAIKLDRLLFSSVHYPTDYGFFPDTWALDDDPLDAMVCVSEPTFPGCQIEVKPISLLRMRDEKGIDDKVLCVPRTDPGWNSLEVLEDIPQGLRDEIAHFFSIYKNLERKQVEVDGWYSREDALAEIEASRTRFAERKKEHG